MSTPTAFRPYSPTEFQAVVDALVAAATVEQLRAGYRAAVAELKARPSQENDQAVRVFLEAGKAKAAASDDAVAEAGEIDVPELTDRHRSFLAITKEQGSVHPSELASEAQVRFVRRLLAEREDDGADIEAAIAVGTYTKRDASDDITRLKSTKPTVARPATERQVEYLTALLTERVHPFDADALVAEAAEGKISFDDASAKITELKGMPRNKKATNDYGIRVGHYAVSRGEGIEAGFYRVSPNGRTFVLAGPNEHPYNGTTNEEINWIKENPREAAALYGQLIGRCGRCHLRLTDDTSRELGIGPICRSKSDW